VFFCSGQERHAQLSWKALGRGINGAFMLSVDLEYFMDINLWSSMSKES